MANGKSKGSQWERDVAKYLTQGLTGQQKEYYFGRSPGSGAVSTVSGTNPGLHGDIIPLKEEADKALCSKTVIECKNGYPTASLDNFLKNSKNYKIKEFGEQVVHDSERVNKYPMLIYKKKGMSTPGIGISADFYSKLKKHLEEVRFLHLKGDNILPDTYFFEYKEFFSIITPDIIKEI